MTNRRFRFAMILLLVSFGVALTAPVEGQSRLPRVLAWTESLRGTDEQELQWPVAVAAASAGELVVADARGSRVLRFRKVGVSWQMERVINLPGTPVAMTWDGKRYVVSLREDKGLVALEGEQMLQRRLGLPSEAVPGALSATPGGGLLVYDYAGKRVLRLNVDNDVVGEVAVEGQVTALAAAAGGGFFAAVGDAGSVLRFDAEGALSATWELPGEGPVPSWPAALAVEPGGELYVVDRHAGRILLLDDDGRAVGVGSRRGWEPGLLRFPGALARLEDGRLLVADEGNGRAQLFQRTDRSGAQ